MKQWSIVCLFAAVFYMVPNLVETSRAQVHHERTVEETVGVRAEVTTVVVRWQEATGVQVTPEAKRTVEQGFANERQFLEYTFHKQELSTTPQRDDLTDALVEHYLYDLRDEKLSHRANQRSSIPRISGYSFGPEEPSGITIDVSDVLSFSPAQFLKKFGATLDTKVGRLNVLSNPDEAQITIDGKIKDKFTCRTFVTSSGSHTVSVIKPRTRVNCTEDVVIRPQETGQVVCPKQQTMHCRLPSKRGSMQLP